MQSTSSLMAWFYSSFILLCFYFTGLVSALMENIWQIILGSIPGISMEAHGIYSNYLTKTFWIRSSLEDATSSQFGGLVLDDVDLQEMTRVSPWSCYLGLLTQWESRGLDPMTRRGSESWFSSFCNCYRSIILFYFLSISESLSETAREDFVIRTSFGLLWLWSGSPPGHPLCHPFLSVWGTSEVDDGWTGLPASYESVASQG